ncbi:hypothetical protein RCO27_11005 [Sphingosinicella sp. LHD-64]|uniref:hypothetical protein n=1 Tax=Sphingosinicella sp. LHD-64 TaxID=3072139 RepID=UPI00280F0AAB|nr:hypothetical protein [Sphingosinicella sp. LHD-64]MDQ8756757.1 hypothetical protein [Sphingosinicella sp. LHD-64]
MKNLNILLVATFAAALAGCWESGADNTQLNDMMIEPPEVNLVSDLPDETNAGAAEVNATTLDTVEPAPAGPGAPTDAAPVAERPAPPAPARQEPDPHAGHDMNSMNHQ